MKHLLTLCCIVLSVSGYAQMEELEKIRNGGFGKLPHQENFYSELYVEGSKSESLSSYVIYDTEGYYMQAGTVEIWISDSTQVVADNLNNMVFLLPNKAGLRGVQDTLYDLSQIDSVGQRVETDSGYYLDFTYGQRPFSKQIRFYYSKEYVLQAYVSNYSEFSSGKIEKKSFHCWITYSAINRKGTQLPYVYEKERIRLAGTYTKYQLFNMLQNGTYEDIK